MARPTQPSAAFDTRALLLRCLGHRNKRGVQVAWAVDSAVRVRNASCRPPLVTPRSVMVSRRS